MPSHLEQALLTQIKMLKLPTPETEVKVIEGRRFRWDLCWREQRLLCEIQGATWVKGGHSTGTGIARDAEKNNLAVLAGWRVLIFTGDHVKSGQAALWAQEALDSSQTARMFDTCEPEPRPGKSQIPTGQKK